MSLRLLLKHLARGSCPAALDMAGRSPRNRLSKLFHKAERQSAAKPNAVEAASPPPAVPSTPTDGNKHVRKSSSRVSLRDVVQSKGETRTVTSLMCRADAEYGQAAVSR